MFLKLKKPQRLALPKFQLELGVAFYNTEMLVINNKHSYIYHFPDTYLTASSWLNNILQTVLYHATNVFLLNANFNFFYETFTLHPFYIHFYPFMLLVVLCKTKLYKMVYKRYSTETVHQHWTLNEHLNILQTRVATAL